MKDTPKASKPKRIRRKASKPERGKPFAWSPLKGFLPGTSLAGSAAAYRKAANAVYSAIADADGSLDAYPLVFLYRHAVECNIKAILYEFGSEVGVTRKSVRERRHDLCQQLPDLYRVSLLVGSGTSKTTESAINQINGTDPGSDRFRYDEGLPTATFNLKHFVTEVGVVLDELESIYDALYDRDSEAIQREMESELLDAGR